MILVLTAFAKRQIKKIDFFLCKEQFERQMLLENWSWSTERCRGTSRNSAFFTPAGYGTEVAEGKKFAFNGKMHVMEHALMPILPS
jgi:3-oxoacid CoA-transferase subunit A